MGAVGDDQQLYPAFRKADKCTMYIPWIPGATILRKSFMKLFRIDLYYLGAILDRQS
jgi:hypothetical protein